MIAPLKYSGAIFLGKHMDLITQFIDRWAKNHTAIFIHVFGDALLDQDYDVKVSRISPECSNVNILLSETDQPSRQHPGGAANVCYQLNNFNIVARLFCFIDEPAFSIIRQKLKYWGHILLPEGFFIPRKKRDYENGFVVGRRDIERPNYGCDVSDLQKKIVEFHQIFQIEPNAIIFSDYNKGFFSNNFGVKDVPCKCITIVDPKKPPLDRWYGCTVFKPNSKEALELSGFTDWKQQCDFFQNELNCKAVVITQEGNGVVGKVDDYFEYRPNLKINPIDIIGAGDCFIGIFTTALLLGFTYEESAIIAFHAGLLYVQKGRVMFGPWSFCCDGKIVKNVDVLRNRIYKLVFANGCFDLMHGGHIELLRFAKSKGDRLVVALNSDNSIRRLKGESRPILPLVERMKIISELESVDFVVSFDDDTPEKLVEKIRPDILVKGEDWKGREVAGANYVNEVCYAPLLEGHSTTQIINKITSCKICSTCNPHTDKVDPSDSPCNTCSPCSGT